MILARPLKKVRTVNSTPTSFTAPVCEIDLSMTDAGTETGRSIIDLSVNGGGAGLVPKLMELWPYGIGTADDVFSMRVIGWTRVLPIGASEPRSFWVPGLIVDAACTISTFVGLAGFPVLDTEKFADTITITTANQPTKLGNTTLLDGYVKLYTFANNLPARIQVPLEGYEAVEVQFDPTTGMTSMNALYRFIDGNC